jgi:hypothetical protein
MSNSSGSLPNQDQPINHGPAEECKGTDPANSVPPFTVKRAAELTHHANHNILIIKDKPDSARRGLLVESGSAAAGPSRA